MIIGGFHPEPCHPVVTIVRSCPWLVARPCGAGQGEGGYRWHLKGSRALRPVWPCPAPAFQRRAFQTPLDNTDCSPASDWSLSRLGTGPATEGRSLTPPTPKNNPLQPLTGPPMGLLGAKVSGQADLWSPAMFGHVHAQSEAQGSW